jgi:hypothetical protein
MLLLSAVPATAQRIGGPGLGYVLDGQTRRMRPVSGIPGAASIGAPLPDQPEIASAALSPRGDYAVVLLSGSLLAGIWTPANAQVSKLPGVSAGASRVKLSPTGKSAALYFAESRRIQVVTGLPADPTAPREFSLAPLRSALGAFAVSDDGELLLCAESESPAAVVAINASGAANRIALSSAATALAFAPNRHDAVLAGEREAILVADPAGRAAIEALPAELAGAGAAVFSDDGIRIYFTLAQPGRVAVYVAGSAAVVLDCDCNPVGLYRMGGAEAYRLSDYSGVALHLLDGESNPPRIVSVPPAADSEKLK